jgi:hypothetical protein
MVEKWNVKIHRFSMIFGVKIIAPACSASIFTPRGCFYKNFNVFYFSLWSHVKCALPQAVQLRNFTMIINALHKHNNFHLKASWGVTAEA